MRRAYYILIASVLMPLSALAQQTSLSLEECRRMAASNDPYVRNSALDVLAARAQKQEALSAYFPTVSAMAMGFHALNPLVRIGLSDILGNSDAANNIKTQIQQTAPLYGLPTSYETMQYGYGASVNIMQPLYAGGRIVNGNRLASLGMEAAQLQESLQGKLTASQVEEKYWLVVSLDEKAVTLAAARELLDTLYKDASSAFDAGLLTDSEMLQLRLRMSELRSKGIQLKGGVRLAKMDLFNAIGVQYSAVPGGMTDPDGNHIPYIDDIVLTDRIDILRDPLCYYIPEDELAARAEESRLLDLQVRARELEKKMALGEALPQVGIGAMYGYGRYLSEGSTNGTVYAMVKIPISDWGKTSSRVRRLEYQAQKARNEQEYMDAQLVLRARQRWIALNTAWEQYGVVRESVELARTDVRKLESSFRAGLVPLSELLQAQTVLRQSEDALIDSAIAYRNALSEYQQ